MNIGDVKKLFTNLPEQLDDLELICFCADDGEKFTIRDDVAQFAMRGGKVCLYVRKTKEGKNDE